MEQKEMEHQETAYKKPYIRPFTECIVVEAEGHMTWQSTDEQLGKRGTLMDEDEDDEDAGISRSLWGDDEETSGKKSQGLWDD